MVVNVLILSVSNRDDCWRKAAYYNGSKHPHARISGVVKWRVCIQRRQIMWRGVVM